MAPIPGFLLRHTATIRPRLGAGPHGDVHGPAVTVRCFVEDDRRMVRDDNGTEVQAETTIYCRPDTDVQAGALVTVNGRETVALTVKRNDGGGFPTPDHLEVSCA